VQLQVRITVAQPAQHAGNLAGAKVVRHRQTQLAIERLSAQLLHRQFVQRQDAPRVLEQPRAGRRHCGPFFPRVRGGDAGTLLQLAQLLADGRLRQEQPGAAADKLPLSATATKVLS
jgi:hypothetical protein